MKRGKIRTKLAKVEADSIVVRGHDLAELIGTVSLGDMAFLELTGRLPSPGESAVFNALAVTLVEHGLTPSAIATRMTLLGAPESLQGAVAAGLLGLGSRFGGPVEDVARMLQSGEDAPRIVASYAERKAPIPGLGHPQHTEVDPRVSRLFAVASANGIRGAHTELMEAVAQEAERALSRRLPINATGAMGAIASDLGLRWQVCRGLAVMARAIGLVAHVQEELDDPVAPEIWRRVEDEARGL
ncbi:MAG TPA: citryl-CoA lyase [Candidatus Dormibacteraeota bacterium]